MWRFCSFCGLCLLVSAEYQLCSKKHLLDCDFGGGFCGWDQLNWFKNTTAGNTYLYLGKTSDGRLKNSQLCQTSKNTSSCLKFRFFLEANSKLVVSVVRRLGEQSKSELWSYSDRTRDWMGGAVPIASDTLFIVEIYAWHHDYWRQDIKLANISFTTASCELHPPSADPHFTATTTETSKRTGQIIGIVFATVVLVGVTVVLCRLNRRCRRLRHYFKTRCTVDVNKLDANEAISVYDVLEGNEHRSPAGQQPSSCHGKDNLGDEVGDDSGQKMKGRKRRRSPHGDDGEGDVYNHLGDVIPVDCSQAVVRDNERGEGPGAGGDGEGVYNHLGDGGEGFYSHVDLEKTKRTVVIDEVYSHVQ